MPGLADADDLPPVPRRNGEIIFNAPWESRAFGMAVCLERQGVLSWPEFSASLAVIDASIEDTAHFYEHWLEALEQILSVRDAVAPEEIEARSAEYTAGLHDHPH